MTDQPASSAPLPFDLGIDELYRALFGEIEDLIKDKRLLIVPSGPLTSLPFQVLVTKKPQAARPTTFDGYRQVAWLGRSHALTVLPAVSSLKALRQHASRGAKSSTTTLATAFVLKGDDAPAGIPGTGRLPDQVVASAPGGAGKAVPPSAAWWPAQLVSAMFSPGAVLPPSDTHAHLPAADTRIRTGVGGAFKERIPDPPRQVCAGPH
jgi:hypothetical protein